MVVGPNDAAGTRRRATAAATAGRAMAQRRSGSKSRTPQAQAAELLHQLFAGSGAGGAQASDTGGPTPPGRYGLNLKKILKYG